VIVVDTSVWITARRQPLVAETLRQLLEADEVALTLPVRLELWAGLAHHQRAGFLRMIKSVPQLYPTDETWQPIAGWIEQASAAGERFGLIDLLIASSAAEIGGLVWSLDGAFERMERLKFVSVYQLPH
jgi:predicted nucleic acid-binding protein